VDTIDAYLNDVELAIRNLSRSDIRTVVDRLEDAWARNATIYIIGNGGSAANASHMANDLMKCTRVEHARLLRVLSLTDNVSIITAFANDESYEKIFLAQLENLLQPNDVLIAISGSGNSPNVIRACEYAIENCATVIGLCGDPGGMLAKIATHRIIVPAKLIGQQEDGHLIINHAVALALRERILARREQHKRTTAVTTATGTIAPVSRV
jgi:D-sedoheptulose 7-phosphate isomerase